MFIIGNLIPGQTRPATLAVILYLAIKDSVTEIISRDTLRPTHPQVLGGAVDPDPVAGW